MTLTSKERVRLAFTHQEPDRVPINYFANPAIDNRLKQHFGLKLDDHEGLRQVLNVDFRSVGPAYIGPELHPQVPDRRVDLWGRRTRWVEHGESGYWDYCDFPLKDAVLDTMLNYPMPNPDDYDYQIVIDTAKRYKNYWVSAGNAGTGDIINSMGMLRTMEQVLIDLMMDDEALKVFIDRRNEIEVEILYRTLEAGKGLIDMVWMGEDLGTQKGPMISKRLYRKQLRPRHQQFIDCAKSFDLPVIVHTCGSSSWVYEDFIEMGVDAVDTLQPEAKNMSPAYLNEHFGGRLSFHGCISTTGDLAFGTVDDVRQHVRETLDVLKPGGGYALSPAHMIQDNSPTENVVAMYEAAMEMGKY